MLALAVLPDGGAPLSLSDVPVAPLASGSRRPACADTQTGGAGLPAAAAAPRGIAVTGGLTGQGFGWGGEAIVNVGNNVITCNDNWEATSRMTSRMTRPG